MEHCGDGPGLSNLDALDAVVKWVEQGVVPDTMIASKTVQVDGGRSIKQQRLLCPDPRYAG
jgi:feruloyl esterase